MSASTAPDGSDEGSAVVLDDVVVAVPEVLDEPVDTEAEEEVDEEPAELPVDDEPVRVAEVVTDPDEDLLVVDVLTELPVIEEPAELAVAVALEEAEFRAASLVGAIAKSMPTSTRRLLKMMALK